MIEIARVFDWSMDDQAKARTAGAYAHEFEEAIKRYASARKMTVEPEDVPQAPQ